MEIPPSCFDWHPNNDPNSLSCHKIIDWIYECNRARGYFRMYYRFGEMKSCEVGMKDFYKCVKWKMTDAAKAKAEMDELYPVIPKNHVWSFKEEFYQGKSKEILQVVENKDG